MGNSQSNNSNGGTDNQRKSKFLLSYASVSEVDDFTPQGPLAKVTACIQQGTRLVRLIEKHRIMNTLRKTTQDLIVGLEYLSRDQRFKQQGVIKSKKVDAMVRIMTAICNVLRDTADNIEDLFGDGNGRMDTSKLMKPDFISLKDEAEIILAHHLKEVSALKDLMLKSLSALPNERARQQEAMNRPLNMTEILSTDSDAIQFWRENFGIEAFAVEHGEFIAAFKQYCTNANMPWNEEVSILIDPTGDTMVSIVDFRTFLDWFGPFKKCLTKCEELLQCEFFWGSLSSIGAQQVLEGAKLGSFLVRFNEAIPGTFCISCVDESEQYTALETLHFRVTKTGAQYALMHGDAKFEAIADLVDNYRLTFKLPMSNAKCVRTKQPTSTPTLSPSTSFSIGPSRDEHSAQTPRSARNSFHRSTSTPSIPTSVHAAARAQFARFRGRPAPVAAITSIDKAAALLSGLGSPNASTSAAADPTKQPSSDSLVLTDTKTGKPVTEVAPVDVKIDMQSPSTPANANPRIRSESVLVPKLAIDNPKPRSPTADVHSPDDVLGKGKRKASNSPATASDNSAEPLLSAVTVSSPDLTPTQTQQDASPQPKMLPNGRVPRTNVGSMLRALIEQEAENTSV